jgi:ketosteroid isomerase-like protein
MNGEELMRTVTAAFGQSDLGPLMDALHEDVVWKSASRHPGGPFSFAGDYRNRAGVVEVLANIAKDYTFHHMTPRDITGHDDLVWGLFDVGATYDAKGRTEKSLPIQLEMAIRWKLKDGKIIEHQVFFDTAFLAERQRSAQQPVSPTLHHGRA